MVHAKNYETASTCVKVIQIGFFFPDTVYILIGIYCTCGRLKSILL